MLRPSNYPPQQKLSYNAHKAIEDIAQDIFTANHNQWNAYKTIVTDSEHMVRGTRI